MRSRAIDLWNFSRCRWCQFLPPKLDVFVMRKYKLRKNLCLLFIFLNFLFFHVEVFLFLFFDQVPQISIFIISVGGVFLVLCQSLTLIRRRFSQILFLKFEFCHLLLKVRYLVLDFALLKVRAIVRFKLQVIIMHYVLFEYVVGQFLGTLFCLVKLVVRAFETAFGRIYQF